MTDLQQCAACQGTGRSSAGSVCFPCQGRGSLDPSSLGAARAAALAASAPEVPPDAKEHGFGVLWSPNPSVEHYTEPDVLDAVREVMGGIDLDPASCALAQETVQADVWYGPGSPHGEDGLAEPWGGRVYLNPPGGSVSEEYADMGTGNSAALWWAKLVEAWESGDVEQAIFMGFTLEILRSTQALDCKQPFDFPMCVPKARLSFGTCNRPRAKGRKKGEMIDPKQPEGVRVLQGSPTHANVIIHLPSREQGSFTVRRFTESFCRLGRVGV